MRKMYRIGYTYEHRYDATLDGKGETVVSAESEDQAVDSFREDYGETHRIDYVGVVGEE